MRQICRILKKKNMKKRLEFAENKTKNSKNQEKVTSGSEKII